MDRDQDGFKVMSTLAVATAFRATVLPAFAAATGIAAEMAWAPTSVLERRIGAGERADVVVMIDRAMAALVAAGLVRGDSVRPVARSLAGLAVPKGAPHPDISTVEALRSALLAGRVAYSRTGASGLAFVRLLDALGIAEAVNARAAIVPEGFTAERLVAGEADLAIQQTSELMSVAGVEVVGPLPEGAQEAIDLSAGIFFGSASPAAAERFVALATSPEARTAYRDAGLVPRF